MTDSSRSSDVPILGILGWEEGKDDTLIQLESIPGNIAHPATFDFPISYRRVKGASYTSVVIQPSQSVCDAMIIAARELEGNGVAAIATGCGFNALFQRELADSVDIPVFASSLLQVPVVHRMLKKNQLVGILTADRSHLGRTHLENVGITQNIPVAIYGIENTGEFSKVRDNPEASLDIEKMTEEIVEVASSLVMDRPDVGGIVLECTDLPPFAAAIRKTTGLPVFDIVTLVYWVMASITDDRWKGQS